MEQATRRSRGVRWAAAAAGGLLIAATGAASAQEVRPLLLIERGSLREMVPAEKDQRLVEALSMVPERVSELAREIPGADFEPEPFMTLLDMLARPGRMGLVYAGEGQPGGVFGYGAMISIDAGEGELARDMDRFVKGAMEEADLPFARRPNQRFEGMTDLRLPFGSVTFGPRQAEGRWSYDAVIGSIEAIEAGFDTLPEPIPNTKPVLRGVLDLKALNPAAEIARQLAGGEEEMQQTLDMLERTGIIGEHAVSFDFQFGFNEEESLGVYRMLDAREHAEGFALPTGTLSRAELSAIPRDAVVASIARMDLGQIEDVLDMLAESGMPVEGALEQFREMTGVDVRRDLLRTLGGTSAMYMSDSTGGGGLLSTVALISFQDRERFLRAHAKLVGFAHGMLEASAPEPVSRYVRIEPWTEAGVDLHSVRFKGVPIPLELTYAATEDWLILGLTPQAVLAAAQQARGDGDAGILAHRGVAAALGGRTRVSSLSFMDSERLGRAGYPLVSLLGSAIANGTRSPWGDREPGMIVPSYHELLRDARPSVEFSYWDGDHFVTESHADRSMLVQVAAMGGLVGKLVPVLGAGVALPALQGARDRARMLGDSGGALDALERLGLAGELIRAAAYVDPLERAAILALIAPEFERARTTSESE